MQTDNGDYLLHTIAAGQYKTSSLS
jgi:hypothetical protein